MKALNSLVHGMFVNEGSSDHNEPSPYHNFILWINPGFKETLFEATNKEENPAWNPSEMILNEISHLETVIKTLQDRVAGRLIHLLTMNKVETEVREK